MKYFKLKKQVFLIHRLLIMFGLLITFFGVVQTAKVGLFIMNSKITKGQVMQITYFSYFIDSRYNYRQTAKISYRTSGGSLHTFEKIQIIPSITRWIPPHLKKDEVVEVLYDPNNEIQAKINSFWSLWGESLILILFGALIIVLTMVNHPEKYRTC